MITQVFPFIASKPLDQVFTVKIQYILKGLEFVREHTKFTPIEGKGHCLKSIQVSKGNPQWRENVYKRNEKNGKTSGEKFIQVCYKECWTLSTGIKGCTALAFVHDKALYLAL